MDSKQHASGGGASESAVIAEEGLFDDSVEFEPPASADSSGLRGSGASCSLLGGQQEMASELKQAEDAEAIGNEEDGDKKKRKAISLLEQAVGRLRGHLHMRKLASDYGSKFSTGQTVHHWWACWFQDADFPPKQIKGKMRPWWYAAHILAALGVQSVKYAGQHFEEHCYKVHCWNGSEDRVPERFLRALPSGSADQVHSAGLVLKQGPAPEFWFYIKLYNV